MPRSSRGRTSSFCTASSPSTCRSTRSSHRQSSSDTTAVSSAQSLSQSSPQIDCAFPTHLTTVCRIAIIHAEFQRVAQAHMPGGSTPASTVPTSSLLQLMMSISGLPSMRSATASIIPGMCEALGSLPSPSALISLPVSVRFHYLSVPTRFFYHHYYYLHPNPHVIIPSCIFGNHMYRFFSLVQACHVSLSASRYDFVPYIRPNPSHSGQFVEMRLMFAYSRLLIRKALQHAYGGAS